MIQIIALTKGIMNPSATIPTSAPKNDLNIISQRSSHHVQKLHPKNHFDDDDSDDIMTDDENFVTHQESGEPQDIGFGKRLTTSASTQNPIMTRMTSRPPVAASPKAVPLVTIQTQDGQDLSKDEEIMIKTAATAFIKDREKEKAKSTSPSSYDPFDPNTFMLEIVTDEIPVPESTPEPMMDDSMYKPRQPRPETNDYDSRSYDT